METLIYTLTLVPILIITLTIHEGGHFTAARTLGLKASGFQVGVGPRIFTTRLGRTKYSLPSEEPAKPTPSPGETVVLQIKNDSSGRRKYAIEKWTYWSRNPAGTELKEMAEAGPCITGKVASVESGTLTVKDTTFSIGAIPLMAMVYLAEDPSNSNTGFINTAPWVSRITTILAGVGANFALLALTILIMAMSPIVRPGQEVVTISEIMPGAAAQDAGLMPGDAVMRAGDQLWPDAETFLSEIQSAHESGMPLEMVVQRQSNIMPVEVSPNPDTGRLGIRLRPAKIAGEEGTSVQSRFWILSETYFTSLGALIQPSSSPEHTDERRITGIVSAASYTGQAVQAAKVKAWIAMLGIITFSMALINLLPVPPLDGFQILTHTVKSLRKGKALQPKTENALTLTGLSLLAGFAIYLAVEDIIHIAGG